MVDPYYCCVPDSDIPDVVSVNRWFKAGLYVIYVILLSQRSCSYMFIRRPVSPLALLSHVTVISGDACHIWWRVMILTPEMSSWFTNWWTRHQPSKLPFVPCFSSIDTLNHKLSQFHLSRQFHLSLPSFFCSLFDLHGHTSVKCSYGIILQFFHSRGFYLPFFMSQRYIRTKRLISDDY